MTRFRKIILFVLISTIFQIQAAKPKLIVAILVDQMRYDYLERFEEHFTTNGFRLFLNNGVFMTFAHYNYMPTVTGPGHASFLSGAAPMMHGIVSNDWYDRKSGREVYCADDQSVDGVGATPGKGRMSPRNFVGDTFADELRLRFGSKVVGISMKDRGAILPAGKKPTGAFWFHSSNGNFVTSTYYTTALPEWVQAFNKRKRAADFVEKSWDRLLDEKFYLNPDDGAGEGNLAEEKKPLFPHKIARSKDNFDPVISSPFGNQILVEFAEAAVEGEKLGQGEKPDLLCISFSSIDYVGHKFGPYSQEVQDMVLRLDRQLEEFFDYLEKKIGLEQVMITLTADHAVAPPIEFAKKEGFDAEGFDETAWFGELKTRLSEEYGPGRYLLGSKIYTGQLYLNHATLERKKISVAEISGIIRETALASGKYQAVFSREQLLEGRAPGPLGQLAINGYNAERSGDVVLIPKPYVIPGAGKTGTTHGSGYAYDTHVPILFFGAEFRPGHYAKEFTITDIVPTLCAALGMNEPAGSMGKAATEILVGSGSEKD
jgi:predicted AlkP superfamily pyrophosphatase or phosphodiesterase